MWYVFTIVVLLALFSPAENKQEQDVNNDNILDWIPPSELQKNFPYFLSGFSKDENPVWTWKQGTWDFKKEAEKSEAHAETLKRYTRQMIHRFQASMKQYNDSRVILIAELGGFSIKQASSHSALEEIMDMVRTFFKLNQEDEFVHQVYLVNANFMAQSVYNLASPILGQYKSLVQIFGTNPSSWKPTLLREIPGDQLPFWLGGSKSHKPVEVYG